MVRDAHGTFSANLTTERLYPGTFQGVQQAIRREHRSSQSTRPRVGTALTGRIDSPNKSHVTYQQTPERPLRETATSHLRVVPTRYTSSAQRHMPTVPGTRHNVRLPDSQAEMDGHAAFQTGDFKRAIRCYQAALKEAPSAHAHRCMAAACAHAADFQRALHHVEKMCQCEPFNKKARFLCKVYSTNSSAEGSAGGGRRG